MTSHTCFTTRRDSRGSPNGVKTCHCVTILEVRVNSISVRMVTSQVVVVVVADIVTGLILIAVAVTQLEGSCEFVKGVIRSEDVSIKL